MFTPKTEHVPHQFAAYRFALQYIEVCARSLATQAERNVETWDVRRDVIREVDWSISMLVRAVEILSESPKPQIRIIKGGE
ncbi:MAG: hypothetical protein R3322_08880 [Kiloniellales bacterium]|jgi:hypothetical protein|nr:hypothetical protein [Kiloniellales bacterium]